MNVIAATEYGLHLPAELEGRLRRCRASVRAAIRTGLAEIAASAGDGRRRAAAFDRGQPRLRFYVYEEVRITYRIDSKRRRIVLLDIESMPSH